LSAPIALTHFSTAAHFQIRQPPYGDTTKPAPDRHKVPNFTLGAVDPETLGADRGIASLSIDRV